MNPIRRQKLCFVLIFILGLSTAAALTLYALKQNINLFYTPTQVVQGEAPKSKTFRVGGMVKKGSFKRDDKSLQVEFVLTDFSHQVKILYKGILPDLFREGQGVIVQGKLNNGVFVATEVLAKHDEKYMPPELRNMKNTESVTNG